MADDDDQESAPERFDNGATVVDYDDYIAADAILDAHGVRQIRTFTKDGFVYLDHRDVKYIESRYEKHLTYFMYVNFWAQVSIVALFGQLSPFIRRYLLSSEVF